MPYAYVFSAITMTHVKMYSLKHPLHRGKCHWRGNHLDQNIVFEYNPKPLACTNVLETGICSDS